MPWGSCLRQLFFGLPSYDSTFNLPEVHDLFFFSSPEHDVHILKDIIFSFLSLPPVIALICSSTPNNKLIFFFLLKHFELMMSSYSTCTWSPGSISTFPAISFYGYTDFYVVFQIQVYYLGFCGFFFFCRVLKNSHFHVWLWTSCFSITGF